MYDENVARAALRALGIQKPSASLIQHWIQANRAELETPQSWPAPPPAKPHPQPTPPAPDFRADNLQRKRRRGYSKSNLEPLLREQGALERPKGIRKPGRPRVAASWFPEVAQSMADGTSLRDALRLSGITLDKRQVRALYRNEEFKQLYQQARNTSR